MSDQQPQEPPGVSDPHCPATTFSLPLRPRISATNSSTMDEPLHPEAPKTTSPSPLLSPGISVQFHGDPTDGDGKPRPATPSHAHSAPAEIQKYPSPMRHHKRTPSFHREVKETLNARSEYLDDDIDGCSRQRINQYLIKDEIGHGSYGAVRLATDQFGKEYAIKQFSKAQLRRRAQSNILRHAPRGPRNQSISRFSEQKMLEAKDALFLIREEIAIMKKLNHPNLVQLYEVLDDPEDDSLYMVLEMCKKGVVMKMGIHGSVDPLPEEQCRFWFRDLILGIEYLHSQGVIHRDIKPDNLLLTEDDVLKIVDFGVSEIFEKTDEMKTAKPAGSPAFLPPELCAKHGDVSGKAADIWSMGVTLYCLRYGKLPFARDNQLEMWEAIKTEEPQFPPDEKPEFLDLMHKILEKDPAKRITMHELREHPWVTKNGEDPLLSEEENCSEPIEVPNALEVNHAVTRRMSHLFCVMKAISKFKNLLNRPGGSRKSSTHNLQVHPEENQTNIDFKEPAQNDKESTAEFANRILEERRKFFNPTGGPRGFGFNRALGGKFNFGGGAFHHLATGNPPPSIAPSGSTSSSQTLTNSTSISSDPGPSTGSSDQQPPQPVHLGIGVGGVDEFSINPSDLPPADHVSESPTQVDFNIYDDAFEAEIERIKRSASISGSSGGRRNSKTTGERRGTGTGTTGTGSVGTIYHTRLNRKRFDTSIFEEKKDDNRETPRGLWQPPSQRREGNDKKGGGGGGGGGGGFADVVARAMEGAKEMVVGGPGGEGKDGETGQ
ncbi:kinase-like domain-containing protein [Sordaria brevicollis]|uniref:Kinase-like domain-containing protein n=1 Tax=Sordaria brevicollis TaxID=83679 RepID=A0AAE0UEI5_SORBR|nr:kinase-like domain-containing protein [Sordaria brevicollis]